jgi:TRAP-type C4-dicarboxylate transport system permease small subunit
VRRVLDCLYDAAGYLAAFFIFAIFAVMIGASVMRELGLATGGSDDIVSWMCAAAAFFGMAHTFKRGDFVRVTLLLESLGPRTRHAFEIGSLAIATAFCGFLFWAALRFVYDSWDFGDTANGLIVIKLWIPQSSFVLGAALLVVAVVDELVIVLRGRKPSYVVAVEERHAKGDFTEDI